MNNSNFIIFLAQNSTQVLAVLFDYVYLLAWALLEKFKKFWNFSKRIFLCPMCNRF